MGKISQATAEKAAKEVCKPLSDAVDKKNVEIGKYVKDAIIAETPEEVTEAYKKHPEWFKSDYSVSVEGNGFSYERVTWVGSIPMKNTYQWNISRKISGDLHKLVNERDDMKKKCKSTQVDIENTILVLGTHKRVEEEYPEVYPYIAHKPTTTALMLNIQPIRQITCALIPGCTTAPAPKVEPTSKPKAKTTKK